MFNAGGGQALPVNAGHFWNARSGRATGRYGPLSEPATIAMLMRRALLNRKVFSLHSPAGARLGCIHPLDGPPGAPNRIEFPRLL